jgi:hypothetical protein
LNDLTRYPGFTNIGVRAGNEVALCKG